ncbi:hypothetical protein O6H91_02G025600 [Diphasiastrum complanatum]|uniref:Uncharacterized protein n=1 Tax=Diphasiastrum complanatum TaxID=34168 RepID=A0ACC2EDF6_DIPCM|nr:hypothetical protein O6H91_02G025600 [Diphasiastrum complanatum]
MSNPVGLAAVLAVTSIILAAFKWKATPDQVPLMWDVNAHPIWWVPKWVGLFLFPVLQFVIPYIIYQIVVRDANLEKQGGESKHAVAHIISLPALFLFFVQNFVIVESATSVSHDFHPHIFAASIALWLLIWLGYNLWYVEPNPTIGILTPWTLSSTTVWRKTHDHTGWVYVIFGVILLIFSLAVPKGLVFLIGVLILWLGPYIYVFFYSYFISSPESGKQPLLG